VRYWRGPYTGTLYPFGRDRTVGYVDARDAIKFINQTLHGGAAPIWRPYESPGLQSQQRQGE